MHDHLIDRDRQAVGDALWQIAEDLSDRDRVGDDEGVVEAVVESDLNQRRVGRLLGHTAVRRDHLWQARRDAGRGRARSRGRGRVELRRLRGDGGG